VQPPPLSLAQTAHGGELAALDRQERFGYQGPAFGRDFHGNAPCVIARSTASDETLVLEVPQERRGPILVEAAIVAHMAD
jgi:hypothetical protein